MTEHPSFPATLNWDPAGGTSWAKIAQTQDIGGPSMSRNMEEVSHRDMSDFFMTYIPGMVDGGELSFPLVFDPAFTPHGGSGGTSLFESMSQSPCTIPAWKLDMGLCNGAGTAYWLFDASVSGFNPSAPVQGAHTAEITVKVTGAPTFNYTP